MRKMIVAAFLLAVSSASAQEQVAKSKITEVGLFKNGLSVVKREIELPGPGTYRLEDLPEPVHGTWWVESAGEVETSSKMREVEVADTDVNLNLQRDLAGKKVTIHFKGGRPEPVGGTVVKMPMPEKKKEPPRFGGDVNEAEGRFLILKTAKGRMFINWSDVSIVDAEGAEETVRKEKKPVMLIHAPKAKKNDKVYVTYLTHGLAWAPSYRVDTTDPKVLSIELAAVVKNEMSNLEGAEVRLITGFPSVEFSHVLSPLSPHQRWDQFFSQITTTSRERSHAMMNQAVLINAGGFATLDRAFDNVKPAGEGVDLHFQSIGKRTLANGEALSLSIAKNKASYERIVEWLLPDNRDANGRYLGSRDGGNDEDDGQPWDALRFKNPFAFPMTTGPAQISADGKFNGQRMSYYVSAGEETMLRITKALSVRAGHSEQEIEVKPGLSERDFIYVGGHRYMKSKLQGELRVANHRAEDIKLVVRRRFSGDLINADAQPKVTLREEGAYFVNRRNELVWQITLKGGEERVLKYQYSVLVSH